MTICVPALKKKKFSTEYEVLNGLCLDSSEGKAGRSVVLTLCYTSGYRTKWDTWDPASNQRNNKSKQTNKQKWMKPAKGNFSRYYLGPKEDGLYGNSWHSGQGGSLVGENAWCPDLSLIPKICIMERESQLQKVKTWYVHTNKQRGKDLKWCYLCIHS
jgi:hypothetical protein